MNFNSLVFLSYLTLSFHESITWVKQHSVLLVSGTGEFVTHGTEHVRYLETCFTYITATAYSHKLQSSPPVFTFFCFGNVFLLLLVFLSFPFLLLPLGRHFKWFSLQGKAGLLGIPPIWDQCDRSDRSYHPVYVSILYVIVVIEI